MARALSNIASPDSLTWISNSTDVPGILKALEQLHHEARRDNGDGPGAVTEAAAINLIVYSRDRDQLTEAAALTAELSRRHPSRSILFQPVEDAADSLAAEVTAVAVVIPGTARQVCCEEIAVIGNGSFSEQMHSIVQPLLIPDIPTFVWWRGEPPFESETYRRMRRLAARMIVDSVGFRQAFGELATEIRLCQEMRCVLSDLAWRRLETWRDLIAQFFDPPDMRPYLDQIESVHVHTDGHGYPTEAVLLLSWLGSRLGWSIHEPIRGSQVSWRGSFTDGSRVIDCLVLHVPAVSPATALTDLGEIRINAGSAHFWLSSSPGGASVIFRIDVGGRAIAESSIGLNAPSLLQLLSSELESLHGDRVYEEAVLLGAGAAR
ncbi:MAG: hypothetical protein GEU28_09225 [Dehalococcoidia bacterium]|nr:hypothetical protein [Dehalococcoidia bacterium]